MQTECSADLFGFAPVEGRAVVAAFDGGRMTSEAGAMLLGATDGQLRLIERFAGCGVDPVRWTPFHLRRRCHRCRRVTDPMRRNSGDRWLIWSDLGEHQRRYRASSSRPPRRSGTGCDRPIAMKAADMTARPMPSVRS